LNSRIVTEAYRARGIPATLVDARQVMITDTKHGRAIPQTEAIEHRAKNLVRPLLDDQQVPVMGGFIGATEHGVQTTIGRGGSDFSAALIGAALNAASIEIWTDVDGMMTTDPRICPQARRIRVISFEEAAELAYFGAKVLHPATVLPAVQNNIPVRVLNSMNPSNEGTLIVGRTPRSRSIFKAIAAKKQITIVDVVAARMLGAHGFMKAIFDIFDRHHCSIDVVSTSEVSISLTVDSNEAIPAIAADLEKIADVKYAGRNAIVCLVGENIRETPQIAARVFTALGEINVRMISQGASEINITFVIGEDDVPEALRRLHAEFFTEVDPEVFD
jgi:aspartate kinase